MKTQAFQIERGRIYRDVNSYDNLWGRVIASPDTEGFYLFEPLNGSGSYWVWGGCLSPNAHH